MAGKPAISRTTPFEDLPEFLLPAEVAVLLDISRNSTYELLKTNAIRSVKFGRLIRVPKAALQEGGK